MKAVIVCVSLLMSVSAAVAQSHPDDSRYEYAVKASRGNYPSELERTHWSCYASKIDYSMPCSRARGDSIRGFDYVYRNRDGSPPYDRSAHLLAQQQKCTALHNAALQKKQEAFRSRLGSDLDDACGEVERAQHSINLGRVALSAYERFKRECSERAGLDDTSSYQDEIRAAQRKLSRYDGYCSKDRSAAREPAPSPRPTPNSPPDGFVTGSGRIDCFGGCNQYQPGNGGPTKPTPSGRPSTITKKEWGDVSKPGGNEPGTKSAR